MLISLPHEGTNFVLHGTSPYLDHSDTSTLAHAGTSARCAWAYIPHSNVRIARLLLLPDVPRRRAGRQSRVNEAQHKCFRLASSQHKQCGRLCYICFNAVDVFEGRNLVEFQNLADSELAFCAAIDITAQIRVGWQENMPQHSSRSDSWIASRNGRSRASPVVPQTHPL